MSNVIAPGFIFWDGFKYITTPVVPPGGNSITTLEGDVLAFGPGPAEATVVGIRDIPVPVPSSNLTVLQYNNGAYNWAAVGASGITALTGDVSAAGAGSVAAVVEGLKNIAVPTPSGTNTVLQYNSGAYSWATVTLAPGTPGQVLMTNGSSATTWTTLSGDVTVNATGVTTVGKIQGVTISGTPSAGEVLVATSSTAADWAITSRAYSNVLYVSQTGNDTTGNGSFNLPFATYSKASTVATTGGAAAGNLYCVFFGPGSYSENIVLAPWVDICGMDSGESTVLNGNMNISSAWSGISGFTTIVSNCDVGGTVNIDALAFTSGGNSSVQFCNCFIECPGNFTAEGWGPTPGAGSEFQILIFNSTVDCHITVSDIMLVLLNTDFYDDGRTFLAMTAPTYGGTLDSLGGGIGCAVTVDGYSGNTMAAVLTGTSVSGLLTINGTSATYTSTLSGVPGGGVTFLGGASTSQYVINGELPVANLSTGTNGYVLTMVSGTPAWAASGGGGGGATYPPVSVAVPTAAGNLTLALQAGGNVGLAEVPAGSGDNTVIMWDNAARPGFYWTPDSTTYGNTALYNPSNSSVGNNPTVDFVLIPGDPSQGSYTVAHNGGGGLLSNVDTFLFLQQWTIGVTVLYTGTTSWNPSGVEFLPAIITAYNGIGPALVCALSSGSLVFALWYKDNTNTIQYVESNSVNASLPHYVVGTFSNGVLSIQVDGGSAVTAGPYPLSTFSTWAVQNFYVGGDTQGEEREFVGSIVEVDTWNRALTNTEITNLNTYYASLI
jgi:hypothetical protein